MAGLDQRVAARVTAALNRLAEIGHGNVRRLQGIGPPEFRLRVGDWRVRFHEPDNETILVLRILHRREAYREER